MSFLVIDGVTLWDFDYVDLGRIRMPSFTVPVTVKSLVFSQDPRVVPGQNDYRPHQHGDHHGPHHHHHHGHGDHPHDHERGERAVGAITTGPDMPTRGSVTKGFSRKSWSSSFAHAVQ